MEIDKAKYPHYEKKKDTLHILICQIKVWTLVDKNNPQAAPPSDCLTLNEVESIEITESFKNLMGGCTIKFPRGTVVKQTISAENINDINKNNVVYAERADNGAVIENRSNTRAAKTEDFSNGKRIRVKIGYTTAPLVPKHITDNTPGLVTMFDGYITKCSISTPIEIKCENLASGLKKITCPNITTPANTTVNDLFKKDGKYNLLKNTGLTLWPYTESCEITVGKVPLTSDLTVADIFTNWNKFKIYSFIKTYNGVSYIAVGRTYFSTKTKESILYGVSNRSIPIQFDYNVAEDGLTLMNTDRNFLAVEAQMMDVNGKFYKVTIRKNPEYDSKATSGDKSKKYQILNETTLSKKAQRLGAVRNSNKKRIDLGSYSLIPFMSRKIVTAINANTQQALIKEAEAYFEGYHMNGIDGSLTIFGDYAIRTGEEVELIDIREPEKNGYYLVEEVTTKFGTSGYRQILKLPYKIKSTYDGKDQSSN